MLECIQRSNIAHRSLWILLVFFGTDCSFQAAADSIESDRWRPIHIAQSSHRIPRGVAGLDGPKAECPPKVEWPTSQQPEGQRWPEMAKDGQRWPEIPVQVILWSNCSKRSKLIKLQHFKLPGPRVLGREPMQIGKLKCCVQASTFVQIGGGAGRRKKSIKIRRTMSNQSWHYVCGKLGHWLPLIVLRCMMFMESTVPLGAKQIEQIDNEFLQQHHWPVAFHSGDQHCFHQWICGIFVATLFCCFGLQL